MGQRRFERFPRRETIATAQIRASSCSSTGAEPGYQQERHGPCDRAGIVAEPPPSTSSQYFAFPWSTATVSRPFRDELGVERMVRYRIQVAGL